MTPAPPDIPGVPTMPSTVADYLRRFGAWARSNIERKIDKQQAVPGILLMSPNGEIFQLYVNNAGAVQTSQVTPGSHP